MSNEPTTESAADTQSRDEIASSLLGKYGPMLGGVELQKLLGFRTPQGLRSAVDRGTLGLPLFQLPGRVGWFVMTQDLGAWITAARRKSPHFDADRSDKQESPQKNANRKKGGRC